MGDSSSEEYVSADEGISENSSGAIKYVPPDSVATTEQASNEVMESPESEAITRESGLAPPAGSSQLSDQPEAHESLSACQEDLPLSSGPQIQLADPSIPQNKQVDPSLPSGPQVEPFLPSGPQVDPSLPSGPQVDPSLPSEPQVDLYLPSGSQVDLSLPSEPQVDPSLPLEPQVDLSLPSGPQVDPSLLTSIPDSQQTDPPSSSVPHISPSLSKEGQDAAGNEDPPVPPPRRKRKKKYEKQPSLENLVEVTSADSPALQHSVTVGSSDFAKEFHSKELTKPAVSSLKAKGKENENVEPNPSTKTLTPEKSSPETIQLAYLDSSINSLEVEPKVIPDSVQTRGMSSSNHQRTDDQLRDINTDINHSLLHDRSSRSRSATPIPGISIEPDLGPEWTADMLSLPESEVVSSETSLAKARGSNTTTPSVVFPSDDESVDGVFADDTADEEGGGDSEEEGGGEVKGSSNDNLQEAEGGRVISTPDSDSAILDSTMVTNLDTGEVIPLSAAEERIPKGHGWSPLSEHLLRRTKEMAEAEGRPSSTYEDEDTAHRRKTRKKTFKLKWRRRDRVGEDSGARTYEPTGPVDDQFVVKYKQSSHKQGKQEFDRVRLRQDLTGTHLGAIWAMEFSICGRLLATAGQDSVVRVWVLATAAHFFHELQAQYQRLGVHSSVDSLSEKASVASSSSKSSEEDDSMAGKLPFQEQPLCSYYGHTADVLDLSWSKNFFLLSSSMDKTVRLWHISRKECLCCFQHVDFVTAIAFHPRDDRYFLSGSLDGKLRLWNIPDKKVALWNEIEGVGSHLITAANFCMNGKIAVVGTYDGRCIFYETEHLKYHTQIHVKSRHGKNKGRKISGVEPLPGEDKLLVTSNDSRIRLYNLKDHELSCKYKGCLNTSSQIKGTFSRDGQYIISGSEDNFIYIWKTHLDLSKLSSARRDRNEFYESFSSHSAPVTTAVFAPVPGITVDEGLKEVGEMVVAADYQGSIKIYVSGEKL